MSFRKSTPVPMCHQLLAHIALSAGMLTVPAAAFGQPVLRLGGWDSTRAGSQYNLVNGTSTTQVRSAIQTSFPGVQISGTGTLTSAYLSGIDVLLIEVGAGSFSYTTALSAPEQSALTTFVQSGKGVLIFTDNDAAAGQPTSSTVNNSYLSPFGLHATGTVNNGSANATVTSPGTSPVTNGPFGTVPNFTTNFPGWFDNLGTATSLATLDANGQSALADLIGGGFGAGSGPVVFFSDSSILADGVITTNSQDLVLNAISFVSPVPEPSSLLLLGCGVAGAMSYGMRKRRAAMAVAC
jgi:hypothetical protein